MKESRKEIIHREGTREREKKKKEKRMGGSERKQVRRKEGSKSMEGWEKNAKRIGKIKIIREKQE